MRKLVSAAMLLAALAFSACSKDDDTVVIYGKWTGRSQYEGVARSNAASFIINDKVYVGLGTDGLDKFTDFWEYTPTTNTWRQIASFPGVGRYLAVGFSASGKGYVGTGYDGVNKLKDFYEYNPTTNTWRQVADFGGSARYGAVALTIADKGYVGTGFDGNSKKDFWQYDPATNAWAVKPSYGGNKCMGASAFTINNIGYLMLGSDNGVMQTGMWSYDPSSEQWTQHRDLIYYDDSNDDLDYDYSAVPRQNAASFVIGSQGYIATGYNAGNLSTCWSYEPTTDVWTKKTDFGGAARTSAIGFGIGDRGYVSLGVTGSTRLDDTWTIAPNEVNE